MNQATFLIIKSTAVANKILTDVNKMLTFAADF